MNSDDGRLRSEPILRGTGAGIREVLAQIGHRPVRQLGQNFLIDPNILRKTIEWAEIHPGDAVVEVGPGLGTLTEALLRTGAVVWAVERDRRLHAWLEGELRPRYPHHLHLLQADACDAPLAGLPPEKNDDFLIVANLPYAISTPWMAAVLSGPLPRRMVLMLQREASDRLTAAPGTGNYGPMAIRLALTHRLVRRHRVSAACFHPRPEVESALVQLDRLPTPRPLHPQTIGLLREIFNHRRKQLGRICRCASQPRRLAAWMHAVGLSPQTRPEEVALEHYLALDTPIPSVTSDPATPCAPGRKPGA